MVRTKLIPFLRSVLAVASIFLLMSPMPLGGLLLWVVIFAWVAAESIRRLRSSNWRLLALPERTTRMLLALAVFPSIAMVAREGALWAWVSVIVTTSLVLVGPELVSLGQKLGVAVAQLPGVKIPPTWSKGLTSLHLSLVAAPPLQMGLAFLGAHGAWFVIPALPALVSAVLVARHGIQRRKMGMAALDALPEHLEAYAPKFVLYWGAEPGSQYQLDMWVPQLKRLKLPFVIVLRNPATFREGVKASKGVPVIEASRLRDLETLLPSSVTTVFYVNNSANNTHMVRFSHLKHIQLLHGDSEKRSSFNPVVNMFDKIYVAGQASVDRYRRNGVEIPDWKFAIVGRPQLKAIRRERSPIASKAQKTVLYAPTWQGDFDESEHSSLPYFEQTLDLLLEAGCRIIFRPHPYSKRDLVASKIVDRTCEQLRAHRLATGVNHVFGEDATSVLSLFECFNESDALITDVSSVVTDYLISGKPFALMVENARMEAHLKKQRIFRSAYMLQERDKRMSSVVLEMLQTDPLRKRRAATRTYYLGKIPAKGYTFRFVDVARRDVLGVEGIQQINS